VKLSDLKPEEWYWRLNTRRMRQRTKALEWWQYVDLEQPLTFVARILLEQSDRFPPLLISWPELVLGSVEERLILEDFLIDGEPTALDDLKKTWQANDLDERSSEGHLASMTSGQHFIMVGGGDGEEPLVTVEYEDQVAVELDPRTGLPIAGVKVWQEEGTLGGDTLGTLILPGGKMHSVVNGKIEDEKSLGQWGTALEKDPSLPSVPFIPILTNPRRGVGRSDLVAIKPLVDGANQFATNMMAAGEHHAVPRKWAVGLSEKDFTDEDGNQIPLWKIATGDVWAAPYQETGRGETLPEIKLGQFSASDLSNFHNSVKMLATIAASVYGLPPNYMGYSSDNPPSAESILYSLERLVRRTEKRQLWYGGAWERAMRIAWAVMGNDPTEIVSLESKWRNAATPTLASKMDAAVKGVTSGIIDDEQAWVDLGYSEQTKKGLRERKAARGVQAANDLNERDQIPTGPDTPTTLPEVNGAPVLTV
jgi:hypothetical protein